MLELYFIFYRIPKMMSQLARERQRSPVAWSILAIVAWLGSEIGVGLGIGIIYAIVMIAQQGELPEDPPAVLNIIAYVFGLGAAILSFVIIKKILTSRPTAYVEPPPPPIF